MRVKIKCIKKNRDAKGNIKSYLLLKETGEVIEATGQQIKSEMAANNYEFINLQIDKAGRLVDKALHTSVKEKNLMDDVLVKTEPDIFEIKDVKSFNEWLHCKKLRDIKIKFNRPASMWELVEDYNKYFGKTYALRIIGTKDYWSGNEFVSSLLNIREWVDTVAYACLIQDKKIDNFKYTGPVVRANSVENANRLLYHKGITKKEDWRYDMEIKSLNSDFVLINKKTDKIVHIGNTPGEVLKITLESIGSGYPDYVYESLSFEKGDDKAEINKKAEMCKKKIVNETIRALEDDVVVLNGDDVHATGKYNEEIEKVKKVWNSLGLEEKFEEVEIDRVEAAIFYYDHKKRLFFGVACGYFAGLESNYSYSEEKIRSSLSALVDEIASILSSDDDYEGWTKEELLEEAKGYIDTNISNF